MVSSSAVSVASSSRGCRVADLDWDYLSELAQKVAEEIARKWLIVEVDDVRQEILLHAMTESEAIARYVGDEEILRRIMWTAGKRYAAKERNHLDLMDDQYYYTPEEVRGILRTFSYTDDEISSLGRKDDLSRCTITDNILIARMDATKALPRLSEEYREILTRIYVYGLPARDSNETRKGYRAVDSLALNMNRHIRTR